MKIAQNKNHILTPRIVGYCECATIDTIKFLSLD